MHCRFKVHFLSVLFLVTVPSARAQVFLPTAGDNAAQYYWKAIAVIGQPRTVEDLEAKRFIDEDLVLLPPLILSYYPDTSRGLLDEYAMVSALGRAAGCERCAFSMTVPGAPSLDLSHLPALRNLMERGLAVAKAYEYAENMEGAAAIYRDLFRMIQHLDQDRNLSSGLVGVNMVEMLLVELEGFLSRDPTAGAAGLLADYFANAERPLFHVADYLRDEGHRLGRWLIEGSGTIESRLAMLYGSRTPQFAVERVMTLSDREKERRLQQWVVDYEAQMIRLAEAVEKPYQEAIIQIRRMDKKRSDLRADTLPHGANPLVPVLVPAMGRMYERFLLAEGQFSMAAIMSFSALCRAKLERWPVSLEELSEVVDTDLPTDPYTGDEFYYRLIRMRSHLVTRVPKWMVEQNLVYRLDVARRREIDRERFEKATARIEQQRRVEREEEAREQRKRAMEILKETDKTVPMK